MSVVELEDADDTNRAKPGKLISWEHSPPSGPEGQLELGPHKKQAWQIDQGDVDTDFAW